MKTLLSFLTLLLVIMVSSCGSPNNYAQDNYPVVQGPNGQQMVIVHDDNGQEMLMNYILFQSLMNSGGYGGVRNYYSTHRSAFVPYSGGYRSWNRIRTVPSNSFNYYRNQTRVSTRQSNTRYNAPVREYRTRIATPSYSTPPSSLRTKTYNRDSYSKPYKSSFRSESRTSTREKSSFRR